jgi:amidase
MDTTELLFAGAAEQARRVAARDVSARELAEACLARIGRLNPVLNAFRVVLADEALAAADAADAAVADGSAGPLAGVPVAIKDDADLAGQITTHGTAATGTAPAREDAEVVRRLRRAGAVLVGKTNVPELTIWPFTETLSFGAARNPWDLDRTPGGSSGGSGAAVAAALCGVALGSDGAGSIRIPSSFCGLFGVKTQRGRLPGTDGWHGLSVFGPIARRVADAALFLDVTADDPPEGGFARAAATPPGRLRIAVSTDLPPGLVARLGADQRRAVDEMAGVLRELGHEVFEREIDYGTVTPRNLLTRYVRGVHDDAARLPYPGRLERRSREFARMGGAIPAVAARRASAGAGGLAERIGAVFEQADVALVPGPTGPPFTVGEFQRSSAAATLLAVARRVPYYGPFNVTGQPAASVPAGFDVLGLPTSVQLVGRLRDEATLLSLAGQIEQARPWADRRPPVG